jgi:uncharacterized membrane protein
MCQFWWSASGTQKTFPHNEMVTDKNKLILFYVEYTHNTVTYATEIDVETTKWNIIQ